MVRFIDLGLLVGSIIGMAVILIVVYTEKKSMRKKMQRVINIPSDQVELEHVGFRITRDGTDFNWPVFQIKDTDLLVTKSWESANSENNFSKEIPLHNIKEANHAIQKNELITDINSRKKVISEHSDFVLNYSKFE